MICEAGTDFPPFSVKMNIFFFLSSFFLTHNESPKKNSVMMKELNIPVSCVPISLSRQNLKKKVTDSRFPKSCSRLAVPREI